MSGRPKKVRKLSYTPSILGFKPYGMSTLKKKEPVFLHYEEYEALRLCDYEKNNQQQAATLMNVSRPTFTRIYISAREKIALAFVEGRQIMVEGGKVHFDEEWHTCCSCGCHFTYPFKEKKPTFCPLCNSFSIKNHKNNLFSAQPNTQSAPPVTVAITSGGATLDSQLGNHFGRCSHFVIINTENEIDFIENPYKNMDKKAGAMSTELMETYEVKKVISGDFGLKVKPLLTQSEIQMIVIKENKITIQNIIQLLNR